MIYNELLFYTSTIKNWKPIIRDFQLEQAITNSLSYLHKIGCIKVYGFVIMPNHIHLIWECKARNGRESPVSSFKKYTSKEFGKALKFEPGLLKEFEVSWKCRAHNFWMIHPHCLILKKSTTIIQKLTYMHENPMRGKWSLVNDPTKYLYSSAKFYATGINDFDFLHDYRDWC